MKAIAIVSPVGGAGRTTLTAILAGLFGARRHPVLAIECDPRNVLALHFGLHETARAGLVSYLTTYLSDDDTVHVALRCDDDVLLVPWGTPADDPRAASSINARLHAEPDWLSDLLARVDLPPDAIALIDTPTWPSVETAQALAAADRVLVVLPPTPVACATLPHLRTALANKRCVYVANGVIPARELHVDTLALLRVSLGDALLPYAIHADAGVPEALARNENLCTSTPGSQAVHDLHGLAAWLLRWVSEAGQKEEAR